VTQSLDHYVAEWKRVGRRGPESLVRMREDALHRFLSRGFPSTSEEEWRFTSVAPIAQRAFVLSGSPVTDATALNVAALRLPGAAAELVFVNGFYAESLSRLGALPAGVRVANVAPTPSDRPIGLLDRPGNPFVALNTAFVDEVAYIELAPGAVVEQPIHVVFIAEEADGHATMAHPRVLITLGANTQASVIETYAGPAAAGYFTNAVSEIALAENAVLNHYKLQYEGRDAYHIATTHVRAERSATCTSSSVNLGGSLVRNDLIAVLNGEGVECTLNGLYCADAQRLIDNHTTIDHAQPHCGSREIYKGILADRARGVFNGRIIVRPDAQKTDAKQTNRALLLSEDAQINTTPQLEIFANDVKCTHGAAVGQLDEDALFYLRSRGLSETDARHLLVHAFAADVLNHMPLEAIRASVEHRLQRELVGALASAA